jgi:hypothetical protein
MKPWVRPDGYLSVGLSRNSKQRAFYVHRLVAEAFLGPRPAGKETMHLNGDRTDNRVANLAYGRAARR